MKMNKYMSSVALSILLAGAMQASTITWDFSTGTAGNVGSSSELFSSGGFGITATGYSSNNNLNNLFGKADSGDEKGLGLNGLSDNEIIGNGFIQLDLSNLVGFSNFKISFNSTNFYDGDVVEAWQVFNCSVAGTVCGTSVLTGGNEGILNSFSVGNVSSTGRYLDIKATSGNVLLYKLQADTPSVPEPSTMTMMLLSGLLLGGVRLLKSKRS